MKGSFIPDEELVMLFLRKHANSTEIAEHTGLKQRGFLKRALDGLDTKGLLRHTNDTDGRYSSSFWLATDCGTS
jgi:hypothetical protein